MHRLALEQGGAAGESFDRAMGVRNPRLIKTICGAGYIFPGDVAWG